MNETADLQLDVMKEPAADARQTPAADYLLQRFLGSDGAQVTRTALGGFAAQHHQDDQAEGDPVGEVQNQPSLTVRLRARLLGTNLGAACSHCFLFPCSLSAAFRPTWPVSQAILVYYCCYVPAFH